MLMFSKMKLWDLTNIRQQFSDVFETECVEPVCSCYDSRIVMLRTGKETITLVAFGENK